MDFKKFILDNNIVDMYYPPCHEALAEHTSIYTDSYNYVTRVKYAPDINFMVTLANIFYYMNIPFILEKDINDFYEELYLFKNNGYNITTNNIDSELEYKKHTITDEQLKTIKLMLMV